MKLRPWHRRILAAGAAVAIVLSVTPDDGQETEPRLAQAGELPYAASPRLAAPDRPPQSPLRVELERLGRTDAKAADAQVGDAFGAMSWYVPPPPPPPPPPVKPAPPPPPTAPPLPFSYLGRYEEDGKMIILLLRGERMYTVSEGEVIDSLYRVERLTGGWLELTYLPLNIRQTISTGET